MHKPIYMTITADKTTHMIIAGSDLRNAIPAEIKNMLITTEGITDPVK